MKYFLRLVPKGHDQKRTYVIEESTVDCLNKIVTLFKDVHNDPQLPVVRIDPSTHRKIEDRLVLQWDGRAISVQECNSLLAIMTHGLFSKSKIHITSHTLRHATATELVPHVGLDIAAEILNQRDVTITKYYSRPTPEQVVQSVDNFFMQTFDLRANPAVRTSETLNRALEEAKSNVGALFEVPGGHCTHGYNCHHQHICIGCSSNIPHPDRLHQIEWRRERTAEDLQHARKEGMLGEVRAKESLLAQCDIMLVEGRLLKQARENSDQPVVINSL